MAQHWKILVWLIAGAFVGLALQQFTDAPGSIGASLSVDSDGNVVVSSISKDLTPKGRTAAEKLRSGDRIRSIVINAGMADENRLESVSDPDGINGFIAAAGAGGVASITLVDGTVRSCQVILDPGSDRSRWLYPFVFLADIFMRLLKMLIMPLVFTSIVTGVASLGGGEEFGRLGRRTFGYYITTSFLAVGLGLILVNLIRPGDGAQLGLSTPSPVRPRI